MALLKVNNLSKKFGDLWVLKDVNFEVNKGDVISIIGPSGAGKTTLLRCINHLESSDSGRFYLNDLQIENNASKTKRKDLYRYRSKVCMVFQNFNLFENKTVLENITCGQIDILKKSKEEATKTAEELLRKVKLLNKQDSYPHELSGGQQQRVAIARAVAMNPDILLLDEPTSALDPSMTDEVLKVIAQLAGEKMTMLIVTHEMEFAQNVSNRVFYLDECGIYEQGSTDEIFNNPKLPKTKQFLDRQAFFNFTSSIPDFELNDFWQLWAKFARINTISKQQLNSFSLFVEEVVSYFTAHAKSNVPVSLEATYSKTSKAIRFNIELNTELNDADKSNTLEFKIMEGFSPDLNITSENSITKLFGTIQSNI